MIKNEIERRPTGPPVFWERDDSENEFDFEKDFELFSIDLRVLNDNIY